MTLGLLQTCTDNRIEATAPWGSTTITRQSLAMLHNIYVCDGRHTGWQHSWHWQQSSHNNPTTPNITAVCNPSTAQFGCNNPAAVLRTLYAYANVQTGLSTSVKVTDLLNPDAEVMFIDTMYTIVWSGDKMKLTFVGPKGAIVKAVKQKPEYRILWHPSDKIQFRAIPQQNQLAFQVHKSQ